MTEVILVKLGGSLITDKRRSRTVRRGVLARLAREMAGYRGRRRLILGHGSGSFGHVAAERAGLRRASASSSGRGPAWKAGVADTQAAAADLHRIVIEALRKAGAAPWSLSPSAFLTTDGGRIASLQINPWIVALERGFLPVTHGDVVTDRGQGARIASTEEVLVALEPRLRRRGWTVIRALWLGDTAGVWDGRGEAMARIGRAERRAALAATGASAATDVTGGMRHRLDATVRLARRGVPSLILDGRVDGNLARALAGRAVAGTVVEPD